MGFAVTFRIQLAIVVLGYREVTHGAVKATGITTGSAVAIPFVLAVRWLKDTRPISAQLLR